MSKTQNYIGKSILIGWTLVAEDGSELGNTQLHGTIVSISESEGVVVERANGKGRFTLPPDLDSIEKAQPGHYHLKDSPEVVIDPEYISTWTIEINDLASIDEVLQYGFQTEPNS
jgi:hypothetical protein